MPNEEKAADSRQSVDLKWKKRKGLEENVAFDGSKTEVGGDAEVDGSLTLNSPSDLKTKDGYEGFVSLTRGDQISYSQINKGMKWFAGDTKVKTGIGCPTASRPNDGGLAIDFAGNSGVPRFTVNFVNMGDRHSHFVSFISDAQINVNLMLPQTSGTIPLVSDIASVRHHLVFSSDNLYACADFLTTPDNSAALTMDNLASFLEAPLTVSGLYNDGDEAFPVVSVFNESGVLYFTYLTHSSGEVRLATIGVPGLSGLTLTDSVDSAMQAKEAASWQDEEKE